MYGVYTAHIEIAALSVAKTVLLAELPATMCVEILEAHLTNADGNTQQQLNVALSLVNVKGTPAGASVNIRKTEDGSPNTGVTWLGNLTTEPTSYHPEPIDAEGESNLSGYHYEPIPEDRQIISPSKLFGLRLLAAPSTAFKAVAVIRYRQIGG